MKHFRLILVFLVVLMITANVLGIQRFPKPEFESGYSQPPTQKPADRALIFEYIDIAVFAAALCLVTWLVIKKRSRKAIFFVSVFSLLYFGIYRNGCICPVGSVQNISLAIFNPSYILPASAIIFFILPLVFTLFFGRTFCAGVCPMGALQDLVALRPLSLKSWIQHILGLIPFLYLGLAILFAATGSDFIICRYDPFIGFFRHNGTFQMFLIGGILLLAGIFIARPYCRFFCPYGVLLNLISRFSRKHIEITPSPCVSCRLCENACPVGAINKPTGLKQQTESRPVVKKLMLYCIALPFLIILCAWTLSRYHETFARVNFKVKLADELINLPEEQAVENTKEVTAFLSSGNSKEALYKEAASIVNDFKTGSIILGGFIGLVLGLTLARLTLIQYRSDYSIDKGACVSCARCVPYCPVNHAEEIKKQQTHV